MKLQTLEKKIEMVRKELNDTVKLTGLNSHFTIKCSEKLDHLLIRYYKKKGIKSA
jgi:Spo0E like sporulation regulatory protein